MLLKLRGRPLVVTMALVVAAVGCREAESITSYEAPRTAGRAQPADVDALRKNLDHMLVAIVPQDDKAWFFKLVASGDVVEPLREPFQAFIASLELQPGDALPKWQLPSGWEQRAGGPMRLATIDVPVGDKKLELAVSTLPLSDPWESFVEVNVNRWMGQLQQPPLPANVVAKLARTEAIKSGQRATLLELVGKMAATGGMAGAMPPGHPPVDAATVPAGTSPPAASRPSAAAAPREFTYEAPADWQPGPTSAMRKAAFAISKNGQSAEVTVMPFPASGAMADPIAQAQRWAGQVGLERSEDELKAAARTVEISGEPGQQFELMGDQGDAPKAILAAMVRRGDQVWFFKMTGDRTLVENEREAFNKFLASIKFTGEGA